MIVELELFVFGVSCLTYIQKMDATVQRLATTMELCPHCPHKK